MLFLIQPEVISLITMRLVTEIIFILLLQLGIGTQSFSFDNALDAAQGSAFVPAPFKAAIGAAAV